MEFVKDLTPVEAKLMLATNCTLKDLLRLTFTDLLFKQAIRIKKEEVDQQLPEAEEMEAVYFVSRGKAYEQYYPSAKAYELPFLDPFFDDPLYDLPIKDLIEIVRLKVKSSAKFKFEFLRTSKALQPYFNDGFWQRTFKLTSKNEAGKAFAEEIQTTISEVERLIDEHLASDPERVYKALQQLGAHVFLLQNFNQEWVKELGQQFDGLKKKSRSEQGDDDDLFYFDNGYDIFDFLYWDMRFDFMEDSLDRMMESFDTDFDSFDSGGDSDGGDSGCSSGCSGCSGCGGCGG